MKILLVEDSATLRHAMSSYIRSAGHEPIVAECGEEALQLAEHTPVDLIIMDVEMPGLDGLETTRLIREWLGDHWIPIIFVTGKNDEEDVHQGIEAGGDDYLTKPVTEVILHAKIRAMERITAMRDQLATLNAELTKLSQIDGLTGLLNRRTFENKAEKLWRQASRAKLPLAVLVMDVDHFKLYNDSYGHPAGDKCLQDIARVMADAVGRPGDVVARFGGEEFVALLTDTPEHGAMHVAEEIRHRVESLSIKHRASPTDTKVTLSIGVSTTSFTTGTSLGKQIKRADKALYIAKQKGRNRVHLDTFSPHGCVLLVDNDETTTDLLNRHLDGHCNLLIATTEEECLHLVEDVQVDVILMHAEMGDKQVSGICAALRADPFTATIPIILFANGEETALQRLGKSTKADACLTNPAEPHQLIALVDRFLLA